MIENDIIHIIIYWVEYCNSQKFFVNYLHFTHNPDIGSNLN